MDEVSQPSKPAACTGEGAMVDRGQGYEGQPGVHENFCEGSILANQGFSQHDRTRETEVDLTLLGRVFALSQTEVALVLMLRRNQGPHRLMVPGIGDILDEIAMKLVHLALGLQRSRIF